MTKGAMIPLWWLPWGMHCFCQVTPLTTTISIQAMLLTWYRTWHFIMNWKKQHDNAINQTVRKTPQWWRMWLSFSNIFQPGNQQQQQATHHGCEFDSSQFVTASNQATFATLNVCNETKIWQNNNWQKLPKIWTHLTHHHHHVLMPFSLFACTAQQWPTWLSKHSLWLHNWVSRRSTQQFPFCCSDARVSGPLCGSSYPDFPALMSNKFLFSSCQTMLSCTNPMASAKQIDGEHQTGPFASDRPSKNWNFKPLCHAPNGFGTRWQSTLQHQNASIFNSFFGNCSGCLQILIGSRFCFLYLTVS